MTGVVGRLGMFSAMLFFYLNFLIFFIYLQEPLLNINDERQWGDEAMMLSRPSRSRLPCGHDASKYKQKYCVKYYMCDYEEIKEGQ